MKIKNSILALMLLVGFVQAETKLTAEFLGSEGNKETEIAALIKNIESIGYSTVAENTHLETHYYNKFEEKNVEMLSFFNVVDKEEMRPLLLANPDFGAYAPFNFLVYKTLDIENDDTTWYGHLTADMMLDIIGEKDATHRKAFADMIGKWDTYVGKEMTPSATKKFEHTKALPAHALTKMVMKFERPEDIEDFVEEFTGEHDGLFAKNDFLIAGFIDFKFEFDDMELEFEAYDAYWVSLLCHFEFSNSIFNRGMPEAGMFAPCSIYFYIPAGTNELHVGYSNVDNWINALDIKGQERIDYMKSIDADIVKIFKELGFEMVDQGPVATPVVEEAAEKTPAETAPAKAVSVEKALVKTAPTKTAPVASDNAGELKAIKADLANVKADLAALKAGLKAALQ